MEKYHNLIKTVLTDESAVYKPNRTGVDTISVFGAQAKFDLSEGFPLSTTKKLHTKSIIHELIWFLKGSTNIEYLKNNNVRIWNEWADKDGNLGPIYGYQWRSWPDYGGGHIDQLQNAVNKIRTNPDSRQNIVSAWNVSQIKHMALPPCHVLYQIEVNERNDLKELDLGLYQRSCDLFLGVLFNIAQYSLLTELIANETGLKPGIFVHNYGDLHIYCGKGERGQFYKENLKKIQTMIKSVDNRRDYLHVRNELDRMLESSGFKEPDYLDHIPQCLEQLAREPRPLPRLVLDKQAGINNLLFDYVNIEGYNPYPHIRGDVAV